MPTDQEIIAFIEANKAQIFVEQHKLLTEARNGAFETAAMICDGVAESKTEYAARYHDEDGARAEFQAIVCRTLASAIRKRKSE